MEHVTVLEVRDIPVADLQQHPANANRGNVGEVAQRLREFGQYRTIVVQESTGHILAGNTVFQAARDRLGWTHIRAELVRCTDARALEILAWDNRARDLSHGNDQDSLLSLLTDLERAGGLGIAGYAHNDLDELRAALELVQPVDPPPPLPAPASVPEDRPAPVPPQETRALVLIMSADAYKHLLHRLALIQKHLETANYSDTVATLAADYCDEHELEEE